MTVTDVVADSSLDANHEPANVVDRDASPDGVTTWNSGGAQPTHYLEITLSEPTRLGALHVVQSLFRAPRIHRLAIEAGSQAGPTQTVWQGDDLDRNLVIAARWETRPVQVLRLVLKESRELGVPTNQARIEEIVFPGYAVEGSRPMREFAPLRLTGARQEGAILVARGGSFTPHCDLLLGGVALQRCLDHIPLRLPKSIDTHRQFPDSEIRAWLPEGTSPLAGSLEVCVADRQRRSNSIPFTWTKPAGDGGLPRSAAHRDGSVGLRR